MTIEENKNDIEEKILNFWDSPRARLQFHKVNRIMENKEIKRELSDIKATVNKMYKVLLFISNNMELKGKK